MSIEIFHWNLFIRKICYWEMYIQSRRYQHWFEKWLGTEVISQTNDNKGLCNIRGEYVEHNLDMNGIFCRLNNKREEQNRRCLMATLYICFSSSVLSFLLPGSFSPQWRWWRAFLHWEASTGVGVLPHGRFVLPLSRQFLMKTAWPKLGSLPLLQGVVGISYCYHLFVISLGW